MYLGSREPASSSPDMNAKWRRSFKGVNLPHPAGLRSSPIRHTFGHLGPFPPSIHVFKHLKPISLFFKAISIHFLPLFIFSHFLLLFWDASLQSWVCFPSVKLQDKLLQWLWLWSQWASGAPARWWIGWKVGALFSCIYLTFSNQTVAVRWSVAQRFLTFRYKLIRDAGMEQNTCRSSVSL